MAARFKRRRHYHLFFQVKRPVSLGVFLLTGFGVGRFGPDASLGLFEIPDDPSQRHAVMGEDRILLAGSVLAAKEHRLMKAGELVDDIFEFHMAPLEK